MMNHYDKHLEHQDQTTLGKIQQQYWTTKQHVIQKLGKKEDEFVVLSDAELDAKLDLFRAIKQNSNDLLRIIERYQDKLYQLSNDEAEMSEFLKEFSKYDKTRAGKMMSSVAKVQNFSSQQRLSLRLPLARLYNEVETFRYRAITDTWLNIRKMEAARTEYRGALLWMKNISQELDPDTSKKLEKFRRVQSQVKSTKTKFDRVKCDVIQKTDLLLASRCNMFSNVLVLYQQSLINFWMKTSKTMNAIADAFKGYQYYEFNIIKDLVEPSKQVAKSNLNEENEKKMTNDETASSDTLIEFEDEKKIKDYNEDDVNDLIDMMASKDEVQLKEQNHEFELLQQKLNKIGKPIVEGDDFLLGNDNDQNLFKNTDDEFEREWQSVFNTSSANSGSVLESQQTNSDDLLSTPTKSSSFLKLLTTTDEQQQSILKPQNLMTPKQQQNVNKNQKSKKDISTWFDLFADLDPLQNPDAIGSNKNDVEEEEQRNC